MTDNNEIEQHADVLAAEARGQLPITVVVTTFNEEDNLERCLLSLGWAAEVIVVDSFSSDRTVEIARSHSAKVIQHAYESHPQQWRWILEEMQAQNEWLFAVDADFVITTPLWLSLQRGILNEANQHSGFYVRHAQVFMGRLLRHGTVYPRHWLRVFRRSAARVDDNDLVDVHFLVSGTCGYLNGDLLEDNVKDRDLSFWVNKQLRFASRQAREELQRRSIPKGPNVRALFSSTPDKRISNLKLLWLRLPLYLRPVLLFTYRYIVMGGFLDGKQGFLYHFTQALFYRLAVDVYLDDLIHVDH